MHNYPFTNSVNAGQLIGHPLGNDAEDYSVGVRFVFRYPVMLEAAYGKRCWGDYSLHLDPETVYPPGFSRRSSFPSGQVRTNRYLKTRIDSQIYKNLYIGLDGWLDINHSGTLDSEMERWTITARYIMPISFAGI